MTGSSGQSPTEMLCRRWPVSFARAARLVVFLPVLRPGLRAEVESLRLDRNNVILPCRSISGLRLMESFEIRNRWVRRLQLFHRIVSKARPAGFQPRVGLEVELHRHSGFRLWQCMVLEVKRSAKGIHE